MRIGLRAGVDACAGGGEWAGPALTRGVIRTPPVRVRCWCLQLVRCVGANRGSWHPATDGLMGTAAYGTFVASYQTGTTFSTTWDVVHTVQTTELHNNLSLSLSFSFPTRPFFARSFQRFCVFGRCVCVLAGRG